MEFIDPPAGNRRGRWKEIVQTLKENKGKWALVGNFSPGVATQIRRGNYKAFIDNDSVTPEVHMKQHWEVTTRKTNDGSRNDIYIRWLG